MNDHGSTRYDHLAPGYNIDQVDQLSSPMLLGLAVVGGAVALLLTALL